MKLKDIYEIIDNQVNVLKKKLGCFKDNQELQERIVKGKIASLKRLRNDFKTKFALSEKKVKEVKT